MPEIVIYTTAFCPYCHAAKDLLKRKGAAYEEIDVTGNPEGRRRMTEKAGGRHVGGCDDLYALDRRGELDRLLQPQGAGS